MNGVLLGAAANGTDWRGPILPIPDSFRFPGQLLLLLLPPPPSLVACWLGWEKMKKKVEREKDLGHVFHSVWALVLVTLSQN